MPSCRACKTYKKRIADIELCIATTLAEIEYILQYRACTSSAVDKWQKLRDEESLLQTELRHVQESYSRHEAVDHVRMSGQRTDNGWGGPHRSPYNYN